MTISRTCHRTHIRIGSVQSRRFIRSQLSYFDLSICKPIPVCCIAQDCIQATYTSSLCLLEGQVSPVIDVVCKNLLHIDFLSPHSSPSLYTNTMLSLWAMASFVESGENCMALTTYVFGPLSAGFVENLSICSPWSLNNLTTLSIPHTANLRLLGE